ncbi:MAG: hypothetical protein JW751_05105 [Polyangiaceae bacterium]|nr:hypothetical protein [Polyangiaceae bacterium]
MNPSLRTHSSKALPRLSVAAALAAICSVACDSSDSDSEAGTGGTSGAATGGSSNTGGDGTGASATGGTGTNDGAACSTETLLGDFIVQYTESSTVVGGSVYSGVTPMLVWEETAREGDCAIFQRPSLFCDPQCITPQTCSTGGTCIDSPEKQSIGTVTITGLSTAVEIAADEVTKNYYFLEAIPNPGLTADSTIGFSASGDYFPAFELSAPGIEALEVTTTSITVGNDAPATIQWVPAADPVGQVRVLLNLSSHGTDSVQLECVVDDVGSVEIPASLLSQLVDLEIAGYPRLTVVRQTADSISVPAGCIDLLVQSTVVAEGTAVQIAGVTYCQFIGSSDGCPTGQSCLENLTCG